MSRTPRAALERGDEIGEEGRSGGLGGRRAEIEMGKGESVKGSCNRLSSAVKAPASFAISDVSFLFAPPPPPLG